MYEKEEKRRVKRRAELIKELKHMALMFVLRDCMITLIASVVLLPGGIGMTYVSITESNGFIALILLFAAVSLLCLACYAVIMYFLYKDFGQWPAILLDRYTLELDRIELLELKTEAEWVPNPHGKGFHREYVTNQYAYFAKHGKFKTEQTLSQGEECYVFVALTKKPRIICVYQADEYLIVER